MQITNKSELDSLLLDLGFEKYGSEYLKTGKEKSIIVTSYLDVRVIKSKGCDTLSYYECESSQQVANVVLSYLN